MGIFKKNRTERNLPRHIAIIMDGNGRWAKKRALPRTAGHLVGSKKFKEIAKYCNKIGIQYLTVYAFSTENWRRPKEEVDTIMDLFRDYLKDTYDIRNENIRVRFLGDRKGMPDDLVELMNAAEQDSKDCTGLTVFIAVNYGGRDELAHAVRDIVNSGISAQEITEDTISAHLYAPDCPDPELIIRPSGEYRLSNFLIWQAAYSEFWYSDVLWPDFSTKDLEKAIDDFNRRNRRFGGV
ncbi:MAG: isoprenyl transferase [Ruminococcaceae bacterium]|nr:isoprenyl transferase [Oscillospiraceae bacterium]